MNSVFEHELANALNGISELTDLTAPRIPDNLPVTNGVDDDPQAAISILLGLLNGTVEPDLQTLTAEKRAAEEQKKSWATFIGKIRDQEEQDEADKAFADFIKDNNVTDMLRDARARIKHFNLLKASIKVHLDSNHLQLNAAAPAPAPAPPAARHLPPLNPRRFDGTAKDFKQFKEIFEATIGNSTLASVEKLGRLLGLLEKEPRELLIGLPITDANYNVAWRMLNRKYGDEERAARELRIELNGLSAARSPAEVRHLQIRAESIIQQLESLAQAPATAETIMMLEGKLPRRVLEKMLEARKKVEARVVPARNVWDLREFRVALETIVQDEEKISEVSAVDGARSSARESSTRKTTKKGVGRRVNLSAVKSDDSQNATTIRNERAQNLSSKENSNTRYGISQAKNLARSGARKALPLKCLFCEASHRLPLCPLDPKQRHFTQKKSLSS